MASKTIEHVINQPFNQIAQERLFKPLAMHNSNFIWTEDIEKNYASAHNKVLFPTEKWKPQVANIAGSLQTNAKDYARFLQEIMEPTLLTDSFYLKFTSEAIKVKSYKKGSRTVSWGNGIGIQSTEDGKELWHWGDNGNDRAYFTLSPDKKMGFVYFSNSKNGLAMTEKLSDFFVGTPQVGYKWNGYKGQGKLLRITSFFKMKKKLRY